MKYAVKKGQKGIITFPVPGGPCVQCNDDFRASQKAWSCAPYRFEELASFEMSFTSCERAFSDSLWITSISLRFTASATASSVVSNFRRSFAGKSPPIKRPMKGICSRC